MNSIVRCRECGRSLHSSRSRAKELCVPCSGPLHPGGISALERLMGGSRA